MILLKYPHKVELSCFSSGTSTNCIKQFNSVYYSSSKNAFCRCLQLMQIASVAIKGNVKHLVGISLKSGSFVTKLISSINLY